MNILKKMTAAVALAASVLGTAQAAPVTFDSAGDTFVANFSEFYSGVQLTANISYELTSLTASSAVFNVIVNNTTNDLLGNARIISFGIDDVTPDLKAASANNGWSTSLDANITNGYKIELCIWDGSNCSGGGNGGVNEGLSESLKLTLTAVDGSSFLSLPGITFDGFYIRYQSLGASKTSYSFASCTTNCNNQVPEPASLALLGLGMIGLVAVRRRRSV